MITLGYPVPGRSGGQAFTLPDECFGKVNEVDARLVAEHLRTATHREPAWQTVRAKLLRMARTQRGAA